MHHRRGLRRERAKAGKPENEIKELLEALENDYCLAKVSAPDQAMLQYAAKLTLSPQEISDDDVEELRRNGFEDRAIHDICCVTAYFAFVNRIADGLGVELEE